MKTSTLLILLLFCANTQALAATTSRYKLTAGMGTGVCEAYLKHLNALPATEAPPTCEVKLSPKYQNIKLPQFELLDWKQHLELIFRIEQLLYRQVPKDQALKKLSFDDWKKIYLKRVAVGELRPQLQRGKAKLNERGTEIILEYDRRVGDCNKDSKHLGYSGPRYFVLIDAHLASF